MQQRAIIDVEIEGDVQGLIADEEGRAEDKGFLVRAYRFGIEVPQDSSGPRTPRNKVVWLIGERKGAIARLQQAAWKGEKLKSVKIHIKQRVAGKEDDVETITLKSATVASVEVAHGNLGDVELPGVMVGVKLEEGDQDVVIVGLAAEQVEIDILGAKASYSRGEPGK